MPPKAKDSKPAAPDPDAAAAEQKAIMESELVTALLRTRLGRWVCAELLHGMLHMVLSCSNAGGPCLLSAQVPGCWGEAGCGKLLPG